MLGYINGPNQLSVSILVVEGCDGGDWMGVGYRRGRGGDRHGRGKGKGRDTTNGTNAHIYRI